MTHWTVPAGQLEVLVVEDEPRLRELLSDVIPEMGMGVRTARSGEEALRLVKEQPPAIVVLDLHLPGMDGMQLLQRLREDGWGGPAIILTAFGSLAAAKRAIGLEVSDFLEKPCRLAELEQALDRARRRLQVVPEVIDDAAAAEDLPPAPDQPVTLADAERQHILTVLKRHNGNRTKAAAELGISRRTLHYRLAEYRAQDE